MRPAEPGGLILLAGWVQTSRRAKASPSGKTPNSCCWEATLHRSTYFSACAARIEHLPETAGRYLPESAGRKDSFHFTGGITDWAVTYDAWSLMLRCFAPRIKRSLARNHDKTAPPKKPRAASALPMGQRKRTAAPDSAASSEVEAQGQLCLTRIAHAVAHVSQAGRTGVVLIDFSND